MDDWCIFGTSGVSFNVIYGSDLSFLHCFVVIASIVISLNGSYTESWRELDRRLADTLWFALGRSGGVTATTIFLPKRAKFVIHDVLLSKSQRNLFKIYQHRYHIETLNETIMGITFRNQMRQKLIISQNPFEEQMVIDIVIFILTWLKSSPTIN